MSTATLEPLPHQTEKYRGQYSLTTLLRKAGQHNPKSKTTGMVDGLEMEVSQELARRTGIAPRGVLIPLDAPVFPRSAMNLERRDLTSTSGAGSVAARTDGVALIDLLRSKSVVQTLGARVVTIAEGNLRLPRRTSGASITWLAEGSAASESNPTFDAVTLAPKTAGGYVDTSRAMLASQGALVAILIGDLVAALSTALDGVALSGGGANEPVGVRGTPGIQTLALGVNGAAPTWANVVEMERLLGVAGADIGRLGWAATPAARSKFRRTERAAGSGLVWDGNAMVDMPALATTGLPANLTKGTGTALSSLILGNWDDLVIGVWGAIDILVDPYRFVIDGGVRIHAFLSCDVAVRHPESFIVANDLITT